MQVQAVCRACRMGKKNIELTGVPVTGILAVVVDRDFVLFAEPVNDAVNVMFE